MCADLARRSCLLILGNSLGLLVILIVAFLVSLLLHILLHLPLVRYCPASSPFCHTILLVYVCCLSG